MILQAPYLIWSLPLLGALLIFLLRKIHRHVSTGLMLISVIPSVIMAWGLIPDALSGSIRDLASGSTIASSMPYDWKIYDFLVFRDVSGKKVFELAFGMIIDPLTIFMLTVITTISFLILIYSIEYMKHESNEEYGRFLTWMLIFIGAMNLLVSADNLIILFFTWEIVGLCSWQLISFWNSSTKPSPDPKFKTEGEYNAHCGMKAFVMTSVGDVFFLIAIGLTAWATFQEVGYMEFNILALSDNMKWLIQLANSGLLSLTAIFFFIGAVGKSAQFPFHEWLPEAMAGPSPVSALIHAATMVKAGVYLVARMSPIFYDAMRSYPQLQNDLRLYFVVVAAIGAFTAFLAATQAMVAKEIKKVLAYSTVSQIGYMMLILGTLGLIADEFVAEAYFGGLYHLMSHAIFKALLFLAAGILLHQLGVKTMEKMGGLKSNMPITFAVLIIGAASLAGVPPLSGFYSKENILLVLLESKQWILFGIATITAILTVFYSFRMIGLVFFGEKSDYLKNLEQQDPMKVKDPSLVMSVPVIMLAFFVILLGPFGILAHELLKNFSLLKGSESLDWVQFMISPYLSAEFALTILIVILGFLPAYYFYIRRTRAIQQIVDSNIILRGIYQFLWNRWYINKLYYVVFVDAVKYLAEKLRSIQTGRLNVNMNYSVIGIIFILLVGLYWIYTGGA